MMSFSNTSRHLKHFLLIAILVSLPFLAAPQCACAGDISVWVADGERQLTYENWDMALTAYNQAIQESPGIARLYLQRGIAKDRLLDFKGAQTDFSKAIELDDGMAEAFYFRAFLHDNLGRTDQALKDVERALSLEPKHAGAIKLKEIITGKKGRKKAGDYVVTYTSLKDICADGLNANWRFAEIKIVFYNTDSGDGIFASCVEGGNGGNVITFHRISPELQKQTAASWTKEGQMFFMKESNKAHYTLIFRIRAASCSSPKGELKAWIEGENFLKSTRLR